MNELLASGNVFEEEVAGHFGILPNFFRSASAAPGLIQRLWGFAKAGYIDNPMPAVFKERLFVWLSRFCPMRYCILRHVGFLLGGEHGHASGDATAAAQSEEQVIELLRRPSPWRRDMGEVYAILKGLPATLDDWPAPGTDTEDAIFACAAVMFVEPARSGRARDAVLRAVGPRNFELFCGCLAFIRTAHYWTMLHPEIEAEEDMLQLMRRHEQLAALLTNDPDADRGEMGERIFEELTALRDLNERRELTRAKRALEEKDRQKDQFIAVLAHELRNPLGAIRAATDAMSLANLSGQTRLLVERLDRQTTAMTRMLEDLLDASRIALGKASVKLEPVSVSDLLAEATEEHRSNAQEAGLEMELRLPDAPVLAMADRVRLRQIVDNVLSNAIKFTPAGGLIEIACTRGDAEAAISIKDTGIGFDDEFAQRMFEPFTQTEQGRDRAAGGLGLGLAIASRLATLQGGSLSAESMGLGQGAVFTLRLPIAVDGPATRRSGPATSTRSNPSVLLIEDNLDAANSLADLMRMSGCRVTVAHDGPSGIEAAHKEVPDLILCDIGLPGRLDGFDVARACRADVSLAAVPLVAISGYSSPEDHVLAVEAGFHHLLTKPVTLSSLRAVIERLAGYELPPVPTTEGRGE